MKPSYLLSFVAVVLIQSACSDSAKEKNVPSSNASTPKASENSPSFSNCFSLEPKTIIPMSRDARIEITHSEFNHVEAIARTKISDGVKTSEYFDRTGRNLLGAVQWGIAAWGGDPTKPDITELYEKPVGFPENIQPGAKFEIAFSALKKVDEMGNVKEIEKPWVSKYEFMGFEDLPYKDGIEERKLVNTCHLKSVNGTNVNEYWYAPGLGVVRVEVKQNDSVLMSDIISGEPQKVK